MILVSEWTQVETNKRLINISATIHAVKQHRLESAYECSYIAKKKKIGEKHLLWISYGRPEDLTRLMFFPLPLYQHQRLHERYYATRTIRGSRHWPSYASLIDLSTWKLIIFCGAHASERELCAHDRPISVHNATLRVLRIRTIRQIKMKDSIASSIRYTKYTSTPI